MTQQIQSMEKTAHMVGIMTGSFHTDYSKLIVNAICERLKNENIHIVLFQTLDASRYLNQETYVDDTFDLHYFSTFEYSKFMDLDALIVSYGTITAVPNPPDVEEFLSYLPHVPVILLEDDRELPNVVHVTVDNYKGMCHCVRHLIEEHNCRKLIYLSGPKGVPDSMIRLQAYLDTVEAHGLTVDDEQVQYGDFTDHVEKLIERSLDCHPDADAIIAANDEMAESAYRVVTQRGLIVGKDIAITGFDDSDASQFMNPPLTTVQQNFAEVAKVAAEKVLDLIKGKQTGSTEIPAKLICRKSCGCEWKLTETFEEKEKTDHIKVMDDRIRIKKLEKENMLSSLLLRNMLAEKITMTTFFENLSAQISVLGAKRSSIFLLKEPLRINGRRQMFLPDELYLHYIQKSSDIHVLSDGKEIPIRLGTIQYTFRQQPDTTYRLAVFPLFFGNLHYGMFCAEITRKQMVFFYTLALEIGNGLRYLYLALNEQAAMRTLEEKNIVLDHSANHDNLTGCFNRTGIHTQIGTFVRKYPKDTRFVAVMGDLDHLKQINDTFGHGEGDAAIIKTANILSDALPKNSLLGRTGGDEFTALYALPDCELDCFIARIKSACESFNTVSDKPYYLGISIGCTICTASEVSHFDSVLGKADIALYQDKKLRRKNVIR